MSIFKRGKKVNMPETKDDDVGAGRRLGSKDEDPVPSDTSNDKDKIETKSDEDDDVVEVVDVHESTHIRSTFPVEPQPHHDVKIVVKKKITGTRSEAKTLYEGMHLFSHLFLHIKRPSNPPSRYIVRSILHSSITCMLRIFGTRLT